MSFDNERDSVAGSKSLTVFQRVEFTDLTKLELLDEAIILKSESINPNRTVCVDSGGPMGQCVTKLPECPTKVLPGPNS